MPLRSPVRRLPLLLCTLAVGTVALAATSPLLFSATVTDGVVSLVTAQLPKGWFLKGTTFDGAKTTLVTTYQLEATACSPATTGATLSSRETGTFSATYNPGGQVNGYTWAATLDLSAVANRWYLHHHCDGTTEVHGCAEAIPVTLTMTAWATSTDCRTYTDDAGQEVCASDTRTVSLAAVQEADVTDTCESESLCDLGPLVSACEHECNALYEDEALKTECQRACPCKCKLMLPSSCGSFPECTP